jgi:hypothetical protein
VQICFLRYLDETVVEEHADHGGAIAGVLGDGLLDDVLDDGLRLGALVVVVADLRWPGTPQRGAARHRPPKPAALQQQPPFLFLRS